MIGNQIVKKKSANLKSIDEMFMNIKAKVSVDASLNNIMKLLQREFTGIEVASISIVESDSFYGMRTFYDVRTIEMSMTDIVQTVGQSADYPDFSKEAKKAAKNVTSLKAKAQSRPVLHIEIDPSILYSKVVTLNGSELTSILLHEIGHFGIYKSDFMDKLKLSVLTSMLKFGARGFILFKIFPYSVIMGLFTLVVSELMVQTNLFKNRDIEETLADRFVIDQGYGLSIESVMTKLTEARLVAYRSRMKVSEDKDMVDKTDVIMQMSLQTFSQLEGRRDEIRRALDISKTSISSPVYKMMVDEFMDKLFNKMHPAKLIDALRGQDNINEAMELSFIKLNENIFKKLLGWDTIKFSDKDLDDIRISIEMITDYDDKLDVIDKIHRNIGALDKAIELLTCEIENNSMIDDFKKKSKLKDIIKLKDYVKTLEDYREKALEVKIIEKQYGVFAKVPKGYEG